MTRGFQNHIIVGNLGADPEMRYLPDGTAVTNFSVAVNQKRGENETTTWVRVTAWNKLAEVCNEYLEKGRPVLVQGSRMKVSHLPWPRSRCWWRASCPGTTLDRLRCSANWPTSAGATSSSSMGPSTA